MSAREATLCFMIDEERERMLLAPKRMKVGRNKWNGYGGKVEPEDISIEACAAREVFKESGVIVNPKLLRKMAEARFVFHADAGADRPKEWLVHIFIAGAWHGAPRPTREMGVPGWFDFRRMPYKRMMPADERIIRRVLAGRRFRCVVRFSKDEKRLDSIAFEPLR